MRIKSVKNISVSDARNGHIVFQRVYSWKPTSAFSNLGLLIQCFYQFARTFDEGVVTGIDFESAPRDQYRRKRDDILRDQRGDTMHMLTAKTKNIIVSIFFDMNGAITPSMEEKWAYQVLLHAVKVAFEVKYVQTLQVEASVSDLMQGSHQFDDFTDIADYLCEAIFTTNPELPNISIPQELQTSSSSGSAGHPTHTYSTSSAYDASVTPTSPPSVRSLIEGQVKTLLSAINIDVSEMHKFDLDDFHLHPSTTVSESNTQAEDISQQQEDSDNLNLKVDYVENSL